MAAAMGEEAEVPVWEEVQWLCSVTDLKYSTRAIMAVAMGEEAEVPVLEEVQRPCSMTDLKYKSNDGSGHG